MRHFVRFAKVSASGSVDRSGWRLRIFQNANEARAFSDGLAGRSWRVESGAYEDDEPVAPTDLTRRFRALAYAAGGGGRQ